MNSNNEITPVNKDIIDQRLQSYLSRVAMNGNEQDLFAGCRPVWECVSVSACAAVEAHLSLVRVEFQQKSSAN